jgi:hypothetical protein
MSAILNPLKSLPIQYIIGSFETETTVKKDYILKHPHISFKISHVFFDIIFTLPDYSPATTTSLLSLNAIRALIYSSNLI